MKNNILFALLQLLFPVASSFAQPCPSSHRPVVLVHGFLGSGDNYAPLVRQLKLTGYCPEHFYAYDWNSIARQSQTLALDAFVDSVLKITGAKKIDLLGHSAGGGVGYAFLNDSIREQKVAHYVHIGSGAQKKPAGANGGVPTLNLFSMGDFVVKGGDIPGAANIRFSNYDHFEIVAADSTAQAIYTFFNEGKPFKPESLPKTRGTFAASGKVVSLGENTVQPGALITWQKVNKKGVPEGLVQEMRTDNNGGFLLPSLHNQTGYLLSCTPTSGRKVVYFFPEVYPGEQLLYLRTLPASGMVSFLLSGLPAQPDQVALVVFSSQKAVVHGRDELWVNGQELSTAEFAKPEKTAIAWFLYDANNNGLTDANAIQAFNSTPFLRGVDMKIQAAASKPVSLTWNQKTYLLPAIPSSEAVMIVVL